MVASRATMFIHRRGGLTTAGRLLGAVCTVAVVIPSAAGWAANVVIGPHLRVERPVRSMKELRDANVIKQQFDYSCGAAALATLFRYGFGENVTEGDVMAELLGSLSAEQLQVTLQQGFSLLDLQRVARARGYRAEGFRLAPEALSQLRGPVIAFIQPRGYRHFVVLRGIVADRVYLADPSLGNVRLPIYRFLESWRDDSGTGFIFVIEPETGLPEGKTALTLSVRGLHQPEIMTAREMLAVGNPFVALPELSR
jgi:predicted double-glycine peptidase